MTLEERIKQMLEESTQETQVEVISERAGREDDEGHADTEKSDTAYNKKTKQVPVKPVQKKNPFKKVPGVDETTEDEVETKVLPESTVNVSSQVSALLEAEGLSEEFKTQAVTIFETAVTERVLEITEQIESQYEEKLNEAKAELEVNIDGFLNEVVLQWAKDNEVAIQSNFKTRLAESFMDGLQSLLIEHNIDLPLESENALDVALSRVTELEEEVSEADAFGQKLNEQINSMKAQRILESFKEKMTSTEFDRFVQLTESLKFKDESQYEKQLNVVLENFGKLGKSVKSEQEPAITETTVAPQNVIVESDDSINRYAQYFAKTAK